MNDFGGNTVCTALSIEQGMEETIHRTDCDAASEVTKSPEASGGAWLLRLYIAGQTPKSLAAISNLHRICGEHLAESFNIEVVDLLENPQLAEGDKIIAIPTLVRRLPEPIRKIIGDLSDTEKTLVGLQLKPKAP